MQNKKLHKSSYICFNEETSFEKIEKYFTNKTSLVFSPSVFSLENIRIYIDKAKQQFKVNKVFLNLPKVLRNEDFKIIQNIITSFNKEELGIVANNIAHIHFSLLGYEVVGGVYLNITNSITIEALKEFNITNFVKSFESFASLLDKGLTYIGAPAVMTFCHCPYKTNFENTSCKECKYNADLTYVADNKRRYKIRRTKIKNCIFELINSSKINLENTSFGNYFLDLRE